MLLEALARNFPPLLEATPPLYDFLTQLAAFDSPIATFLDEEIRAFKNFPMTCQSLQSLATYLKFDWNTPHTFRDLFKARLFDYLGKLDIDGQPEWYTRRSRFDSSDPAGVRLRRLGPAAAAEAGRGATSSPTSARRDRGPAAGLPGAAAGGPGARRRRLRRQPAHARRRRSSCPTWRSYEDKARDLAQALHEFVTIERHVALGDWKAHPARPARAAGADGRDPPGPLLSRPTRTPRWPPRSGSTGGATGCARSTRRRTGRPPRASRSGCRRSRPRSASGRRRGCGSGSGWRRPGSIATCTTPWP